MPSVPTKLGTTQKTLRISIRQSELNSGVRSKQPLKPLNGRAKANTRPLAPRRKQDVLSATSILFVTEPHAQPGMKRAN